MLKRTGCLVVMIVRSLVRLTKDVAMLGRCYAREKEQNTCWIGTIIFQQKSKKFLSKYANQGVLNEVDKG